MLHMINAHFMLTAISLSDDQTNVLWQKSLRASIMVSDFIDKVSGYLMDEQG